MMAHITHSARTNFGARVVIIVPLIQLVEQTVAALESFGIPCGVLRGNDRRRDPFVVVASAQTLVRRDPPAADIVIVDECHLGIHVPAMAMFPLATIIGFSATPYGLLGVFDAIEPAATYRELIADGFIAEPLVYGCPPIDLSGVRTIGGDYNEGELQTAMMDGALVGNIVEEWAKAEGRRTVVFASGVQHSLAITKRFNAAGVKAEHMDAETSLEERAAILARLEVGTTRIVSNCGCLTAGWNQPSVRCCVLARPTKSLTLYRQMAGRVLRAGAQQPIIIDHAGNTDRHGYPHEDIEWTLNEVKRTRSVIRTCPKCFAMVEASKRTCPLCGFTPATVARPEKEEVAASLVIKAPVDEKRRVFDADVVKSRERGMKPGFASAKYKEKHGNWPPWGWSQEVKAMFARDPEWQRRNADREREKAFWQAQDRKAREPAGEREAAGEYEHSFKPVEPPAEPETEHAFAGMFSDEYKDIPF